MLPADGRNDYYTNAKYSVAMDTISYSTLGEISWNRNQSLCKRKFERLHVIKLCLLKKAQPQ